MLCPHTCDLQATKEISPEVAFDEVLGVQVDITGSAQGFAVIIPVVATPEPEPEAPASLHPVSVDA